MNAPSRCALACFLLMTLLAACTGGRIGVHIPQIPVESVERIAGTYHRPISSRSGETLRESFEVQKDGSFVLRTPGRSFSGTLRFERGLIRGQGAGGGTFTVSIYECEGIRILETYWAVLRTPPGYRRAPGDLPGRGEIVMDQWRYYYQSEGPIPDRCRVG